ncbi:NAD(P)H-dependent oxidoreductase [Thalassotalea sp. Y01]|uniref:NAD(P)H-dependent oxidoreductase n=1 Tax=Thalassotalea sp. Y01 TaxID=2729613 RepID=UPI00145CC5AE|nr:NAD(P)H-dependent oxidoreductase [Thalassotalea sp. Y01]NMP17425.1 flavodoxin family protein [Thalassotalea sp. Y01]
MNKSNKILLLFAHPSQRKSSVNVPIFKKAKELDFVTAVDLYAEYPRFNIDISKEQQRVKEHQVIIFQFPFYWYSTPSILKEWQDLVLEWGWAYGATGNALREKTFMCAITTGAKEDAYNHDGLNHYTIRELLQPLRQTARLTQMHYLPPFMLFSSLKAKDEQRLTPHLQQWQNLLLKLHQGAFDVNRFNGVNIINPLIDAMATPNSEGKS